MKRQKTNFFTLVIISLVSVSFAQEKPYQFFTEPQPSESQSLTQIPKELIRKYKDESSDYEVTVEKNAIYVERKVKVTIPKDKNNFPFKIENSTIDDEKRTFLISTDPNGEKEPDNKKFKEVFDYYASASSVSFFVKEAYPLILNSNLVIKEIDKGNYVVSVKNPENGLWQVVSFVVYKKKVSLDFYSFNNVRENLKALLKDDTKLNNLKNKTDDNDYYTKPLTVALFDFLRKDENDLVKSKIFDVDVLSGKIDIK
jgi:hypothetical protein